MLRQDRLDRHLIQRRRAQLARACAVRLREEHPGAHLRDPPVVALLEEHIQ
jgi:hypothetical protein